MSVLETVRAIAKFSIGPVGCSSNWQGFNLLFFCLAGLVLIHFVYKLFDIAFV